MADLAVDAALVGRDVCNATRPEWGVGEVLRVQPTLAAGKPTQRVTIQFRTGRRTLFVPPARLIEPEPEPTREQGWLDALGKRTLDDHLRRLPESAAKTLGPPRERVTALVRLYRYDETPAALLRWARDQVAVADPLSHWSRDELLVAFRAFCTERDTHLRVLLAKLRQSDGPEAIEAVLNTIEPSISVRMRAALAKPL